MNRDRAILAVQEFLSAYEKAEQFAANRGRGPTKLRKWERSTNAYQSELAQYYEGWSDDLAKDLANEEDPDKRDELMAAALLVLALDMKAMGRRNIMDGMALGLGDKAPSPALVADIAQMMADNDGYVDSSLIPDLQYKLRSGLLDPEVLASGVAAILGLLAAYNARVESYAGSMWTAIQRAVGEAAQQGTEAGTYTGRVMWQRDPLAKHCDDCLNYGDDAPGGRIYDSWDGMMAATGGRLPGQVRCSANCRCSVWVETADGNWVRP